LQRSQPDRNSAAANPAAGKYVLPLKIIPALMLCSVLAVLGLQAWHSADGYAIQHRAHMKIEAWYAGPGLPTDAQWKLQLQQMQRATGLMPADPSFHLTMGRLYEFRAFRMEQGSIGRTLNALKAMRQFRMASVASPAWVYPWMDLALTKARIGQLDTEFMQAYLRAVQLGPWETNTMSVLVELGLHAYASMTAAQQQQTAGYIDRVARGEGGFISGMLKSRGSRDDVCGKLIQLERRMAFEKICGGWHS